MNNYTIFKLSSLFYINIYLMIFSNINLPMWVYKFIIEWRRYREQNEKVQKYEKKEVK